MAYYTLQVIMLIGTFAIAIGLAVPCRLLIGSGASSSDRYTHLDGLRALSAVAVVFCHVNQHLLSFFRFPERPEHADRLGIVGVQMFFALTAFLFAERAFEVVTKPADFLAARARRIIPLYVATASVAIPLSIYYSSDPVTDYVAVAADIVDVFSFPFLGASTLTILDFNVMRLLGVAWTLSYEWAFYFFLPPLIAVYLKSRRMFLLVGIGAVAFAARDFYRTGEVVWPFFVGGFIASLVKYHCPPLPRWGKNVLSVGALLQLGIAIVTPGFFTFSHLLLATGLFVCVLFGEPRILKTEALRFLGHISYSVYLLQYLILMPVVQAAWDHDIATASPIIKFAVAFSIIAILIPLSCVSYRLIELPWMRR